MTAMYDPQCECPDCSEERERRALKQKQPAPDVEKLARETAEKMAKECAERMESDESYDFTPAILSALHEVLRGKEAECQTCETLCQQCGVEHAAKIKGKDAEIARFTNENKEMRATIKEVLPTLDEIAQTEQCVQKVPCASCDTRSIARRLRDTLDKHGEAPPSPVAGQ